VLSRERREDVVSQKVVLINDPGIDGAFAVTLALKDPKLEVLGLLATSGNVSAEQATRNIHVLIEQLDPPRWPRLGAAPPVVYDTDGKRLHGPDGLGNVSFPSATLHHLPLSEKILLEIVRQDPHQVTVICLGPLTVLSRALDLCPELPGLVKRIVCVGGTLQEPGNAGPVSEFHFFCDPTGARKVVRCGAPITLIPLDMMRKVLYSPSDLFGLPADASKACRFLRQIVPYGIAATSNIYGIEGFFLKDVLGLIAAALPEAIHTKAMRLDVETRGELTRGMTVFDQRPWEPGTTNVDVATQVDGTMIRGYIDRLLRIET
jgi:inosine-uridine nucleoside N-ribohydrolase